MLGMKIPAHRKNCWSMQGVAMCSSILREDNGVLKGSLVVKITLNLYHWIIIPYNGLFLLKAFVSSKKRNVRGKQYGLIVQ